MAIEKARKPLARHALQPEPDGLPMSSQMRRNFRVTQALFGELRDQRHLCESCMSIGYYGLSDIYGNIADVWIGSAAVVGGMAWAGRDG